MSYRIEHGEILPQLVIDHLCRNRSCVRPSHLEAVEHGENVRRGATPYGVIRTTCKRGHDIGNENNVYTEPGGGHRCRVCASEENARRTAARRASGDKRKILKTHCVRGHAYDQDNTHIAQTGRRTCRACARENAARYYRERRS